MILNPITNKIKKKRLGEFGILLSHWGNDLSIEFDIWKEYYDNEQEKALIKIAEQMLRRELTLQQ